MREPGVNVFTGQRKYTRDPRDKLLKLGALVSTCAMDGLNLKREGVTFAVRTKDFTPKADLNILFVFARRK
jgi:hypothetical protein